MLSFTPPVIVIPEYLGVKGMAGKTYVPGKFQISKLMNDRKCCTQDHVQWSVMKHSPVSYLNYWNKGRFEWCP